MLLLLCFSFHIFLSRDKSIDDVHVWKNYKTLIQFKLLMVYHVMKGIANYEHVDETENQNETNDGRLFVYFRISCFVLMCFHLTLFLLHLNCFRK